MRLVRWMVSGSVLSALLFAALLPPERLEVWLGMLGPLAAAVVSWEAMKRQSRRSPERMTALLIKAFAAKMVFFGLYTAALLKLGTLRPVAFVTSLLSYFISLHILEAIGLRRLEGSHCSPPPVLEETDRCGS